MQSDLRFNASDLDHFSELTQTLGRQNRITQTAPGDDGFEVSVLKSSGFMGWRTDFRAGTVREMDTPPGSRTFGLLIPRGDNSIWCHRKYDAPSMLMLPKSDYVAADTYGMFGYQLTFDDQLVEEALLQLELPEGLGEGAALLDASHQTGRELFRDTEGLWDSSATVISRSSIEDLLATFLREFSGNVREYRSRAQQRRRALGKALEYMDAHLSDTITLADICRHIGASRRSVTEAFREALGVSPMAYLKNLRLNEARTVLLRSCEGEVQVTDVANNVGLWHMGQFAQDYRKLFQELPSETLANDRTGKPG